MASNLLIALAAGALLGLAAASLLVFNGRLSGVSGILEGVLTLRPRPRGDDAQWRVAFLAGLLAGGLLLLGLYPEAFPTAPGRSLATLAVAGLLVGYGSRLGGGCTSGHGVCGMGRLSPRSIAATLAFMATGALAVAVVNHLLGGAL